MEWFFYFVLCPYTNTCRRFVIHRPGWLWSRGSAEEGEIFWGTLYNWIETKFPTWVPEYTFTGNWKNRFQDYFLKHLCWCHTDSVHLFHLFQQWNVHIYVSFMQMMLLMQCLRYVQLVQFLLYYSCLSWMSVFWLLKNWIISWCLLMDPAVWNFTLV